MHDMWVTGIIWFAVGLGAGCLAAQLFYSRVMARLEEAHKKASAYIGFERDDLKAKAARYESEIRKLRGDLNWSALAKGGGGLLNAAGLPAKETQKGEPEGPQPPEPEGPAKA